jgi:cysteine desulfurase
MTTGTSFMERIYLDHAATTPVLPKVCDAMAPYFTGVFGNASSLHAAGRDARAALEGARAVIARAIGALPAEVVFTSGGTESDNAAIAGVLQGLPDSGSRRIVTSATEHHAVLAACEAHGTSRHAVTVLPVNPDGTVNRESLAGSLVDRPLIVSLMLANNEVGAITPYGGIADEIHKAGALLHADAVQCLGKIPVHVAALGVDLMSMSAHKLYGPKGIGALFIRNGTPWSPVLFGGGQERGRRPGTENVALAVGFAGAVEAALATMTQEAARLTMLRNLLEQKLVEELPGVLVNACSADRLPHLLNISFDDAVAPMEGEMLVVNLDLMGIAASSGSACTSGSVQPSHVLLAMGRTPATAAASVRFSFGKSNTAEDVERVAAAMKEIVGRMHRR